MTCLRFHNSPADQYVQLNSNVAQKMSNFQHWMWNSLFCPTLVKIKGCTVIGKSASSFLKPDYTASWYQITRTAKTDYPHTTQNVSIFWKMCPTLAKFRIPTLWRGSKKPPVNLPEYFQTKTKTPQYLVLCLEQTSRHNNMSSSPLEQMWRHWVRPRLRHYNMSSPPL